MMIPPMTAITIEATMAIGIMPAMLNVVTAVSEMPVTAACHSSREVEVGAGCHCGETTGDDSSHDEDDDYCDDRDNGGDDAGISRVAPFFPRMFRQSNFIFMSHLL